MRRADQLTVAHLLAFLKARGHEVDLHAIDTGGEATEEQLDWLNRTCRKVFLYPNRLLRIIGGFRKVLQKGVPVQVGLFSNSQQRKALDDLIGGGSYDLVYTYYFRSAEQTRRITRRRGRRPASFLAMQLSQTLNTQRIAQNAPNFLNKLFYSLETRLVARYESSVPREFDRVVLIGERDLETINGVCAELGRPPLDNVVFCAHGVDANRFAPRTDLPQRTAKLVFSGVMRTPTNVHAVQWFVSNVWPLVRAARPDASFDIVGREPTKEVLALGSVPGVTVVGTVPDTSVPIASATICVNSMQAGGGMQNKLIEYLGSAKAVVATSVANEGIGATPGEHLLIADDPRDFADAILRLLNDDALRQRLAGAARQFILDKWTWEAHFLKLETAFMEAVAEREAASAQDRG
jgi:glycosyltransferase involved in cell wall biosynthesis